VPGSFLLMEHQTGLRGKSPRLMSNRNIFLKMGGFSGSLLAACVGGFGGEGKGQREIGVVLGLSRPFGAGPVRSNISRDNLFSGLRQCVVEDRAGKE